MSSLFSSSGESTGLILKKHITIHVASNCTGYNIQHLRRLLRSGRLRDTKVGQIWPVALDDFERYLDKVLTS